MRKERGVKTDGMEIRPAWIETERQRPICDVPWLGLTIVQADGNVNFCCFSNGIVGNVYQTDFEEIWNSREMRLIRLELSEQRLPAVCRSDNCPIFRGDRQHSALYRMEGMHGLRKSGAEDPRRIIREGLRGSGLRMSGDRLRIGDHLRLELVVKSLTQALATHYYQTLIEDMKPDLFVKSSLPPLTADLFVCLRSAEGAVRFLPSGEDFAVPFEISLPLTGSSDFIRVPLWDGPIEGVTVGKYEICAALFETESNPNLVSNCFWATSRNLTVNPQGLIRSVWRRLLPAQ